MEFLYFAQINDDTKTSTAVRIKKYGHLKEKAIVREIISSALEEMLKLSEKIFDASRETKRR